jgi:glyoxylate reductase/hydroxypyruvate reductase 2
MPPILAFPALAGMSYPRLEPFWQIAPDAAAIAALPVDARAKVRVLMTSASRGCSAAMVDLLPNLAFVISQGAGLDKIDTGALAARGIRLRSVSETVTEDVPIWRWR